MDLAGSERTSKTNVAGGQQIKNSMQGAEGICINIDLWAFGYGIDLRAKVGSSARKKQLSGRRNSGSNVADAQKEFWGQMQKSFPSILCQVLGRSLNGDARISVVMCVSPSAYNASETAFTVEFGERCAKLPLEPVPRPMEDFEALLARTRRELKENNQALQSLENSVAGTNSKSYPKRFNMAQALAAQLAAGLSSAGLAPKIPVESNGVFVSLPDEVDQALRAAGQGYYPFGEEAWRLTRLMCSFDTQRGDVEAFLADVSRAMIR